MANIKISDLTAASAAADANEFEINEAGTSKKVTGSQIKAYVNSADGALASKDTVATADIDNDAVTTAKILDANVTTAKLAADAVDGTKIADNAIGAEHIQADAVGSSEIAANAVGADELNVTGNGTAGQFLSSDGDGSFSWGDAGGGASPQIQIFTAPGTWTKPASVSRVEVIVVGGGGGATASNWNPPGNPGGTSSFGSLVSATGGNGAPGNPGGNSLPGSGTVSAGTTISTGYKVGTTGSVISYMPNLSSVGNTWGNNTTYNTGLYGNAGAGSTTYNGGGAGGAAHAFCNVTNPQAVTIGNGGNGSGPQSNRGSMKGAVVVKWWD